MRGKTIDYDFFSQFVAECVSQKKSTPKDISSEAKIRISSIDNEIRRIESLKAERCSLLDIETLLSPAYEKTVEEDTADDSHDEDDEVVSLNPADCGIRNDPFEVKVLSFLAENESASVKDLVVNIGLDQKQKIFFAIKNLLSSGSVVRDVNGVFTLCS